jgi:hypothetical protein
MFVASNPTHLLLDCFAADVPVQTNVTREAMFAWSRVLDAVIESEDIMMTAAAAAAAA